MAKKSKKKSNYVPLSEEDYNALINKVKAKKSPDEKRFIKLGWIIMEAKYRYYRLDDPTLPDHEYDRIEREYDTLSKKLGLPPTAADMVGFDINRPSGSLIADKVDGRNPPEDKWSK